MAEEEERGDGRRKERIMRYEVWMVEGEWGKRGGGGKKGSRRSKRSGGGRWEGGRAKEKLEGLEGWRRMVGGVGG